MAKELMRQDQMILDQIRTFRPDDVKELTRQEIVRWSNIGTNRAMLLHVQYVQQATFYYS